MTSLAERMLTFATLAPQAESKKALGSCLLDLIQMLGAARYACLYLSREPGGHSIDRSIANVPPLVQQAYLERGYDPSDPIFSSRGGACGYWSELSRQPAAASHRTATLDRRDLQMKEGFTKRVMLDHGGLAVVMAAGESLARSDRARAALRTAFEVFANEGARLIRLKPEPNREAPSLENALSRTQLQVLAMRAQGLSNRDIAEQMQRREKTVECHVTEILRRLDARNMIEAIRIATTRKLLV